MNLSRKRKVAVEPETVFAVNTNTFDSSGCSEETVANPENVTVTVVPAPPSESEKILKLKDAITQQNAKWDGFKRQLLSSVENAPLLSEVQKSAWVYTEWLARHNGLILRA